MTIQKKFSFLMVGTILAFILAILVYFVMMSTVEKIEGEKRILSTLSFSLLDLKGELGLIDNSSFGTQVNTIISSKSRLDEAFMDVANSKYLPRANADIEHAITIIGNLKNLFTDNWSEFEAQLPEMRELVIKVLYSEGTIVNQGRLESSFYHKNDDDNSKVYAVLLWNRILSSIGILNTNLSSSISVLDEQFVNIEKEIKAIKKRAFILSVIIAGIILSTLFVLFITFARRLALGIKEIERGINCLSQGDLTVEVGVKSRDELGTLSANLNSFIGQLNAGIRDIKHSAEQNRGIKDELKVEVSESSIQARQIKDRTNQILATINTMNDSASDSSTAVESLAGNIEKMGNDISTQMAMVEESSSAVVEMITSISNVSEITEKKGKATELLVVAARNGGEQLEKTTRIIKEIHSSVDEISGTASVIQGVASQTNLLAMNAAIEAAHAGDAGRGFAVVADEIRKLAETSSQNSKRIAGVIKDVVKNIEEAVSSGLETHQAFGDIDSEVQGVSNSLKEISANMSELNTGGQQILKAMDELQNVSTGVTHSSQEMNEAVGKIDSSMKNLKNISMDINLGTSEIEGSIVEISESMENVNGMSSSLNNISESLSTEVARYITSAAELSDHKSGLADKRMNNAENVLSPGSISNEINDGESISVEFVDSDNETTNEEHLFEEYKEV